MIRNNKKYNFDLKNFLSKKNLDIHKKFLRIDRLNFLKNLILKKKKIKSVRVWNWYFYTSNS